jgi:hypothetical protein
MPCLARFAELGLVWIRKRYRGVSSNTFEGYKNTFSVLKCGVSHCYRVRERERCYEFTKKVSRDSAEGSLPV